MNLIFDVDDTLYDQMQPFLKAYNELWKDTYKVDIDKLYKISREYGNAIFDKVVRKEITVDESGSYRMKMAMQDLGFTISEEEALAFQLRYRYYQAHLTLSKTMEDILTYCVEHNITLGVLTNGVKDHQRSKINGLGLIAWIPEDHMFVSDEIGYAKPDANAFLHIEQRLHLSKEDTWYVGDSITHDMEGAKQVGWHTIFMNRREHDSSQTLFPPDVIVTNEEELFTWLKTR